jgi:signal transduction histidine kinase
VANLRQLLALNHYQVDQVTTVAKAIDARDFSVYSAILLDIPVSGESVFEMLPRLRQHLPDLPVLVISEQPEVGRVIEAIRGHAIEYIPKPIDRDMLLGRLEQISMQEWGERGGREGDPVAGAILDSMRSHMAVLDESGKITRVNRAWREFAMANRAGSESLAEGANYFEVCARVIGDDIELARAFVAGIVDVFARRRPSFELEYPCDSPSARRWFVGRVTLLHGDSPRGVVISHVDITDRKRTEEALHASAARLKLVSRRMVDVQEQERGQLARELHDEIGQVLSAISVNLHSVKSVCDAAALSRIDESIDIVDRATRQVHNLSLDLRPRMLDDLGLVATVRWYADRQAQRAGFAVHFEIESSAARLPVELTVACFRVVQEALTNIVRHARARNVWIDLRQSDDEVDLAVRDDGAGFEIEDTRRNAVKDEHSGLLGIEERVELLGGRSDIRSQLGDGTSVHVWFPTALAPSRPVSSEGTP